MVSVFGYLEFQGATASNGEAGIVEVVCLTILSFPIGLILPFVWTAIVAVLQSNHILGGNSGSSVVSISMLISYVVLGYWQWFVLLPKIIARIQKWIRDSLSSPFGENHMASKPSRLRHRYITIGLIGIIGVLLIGQFVYIVAIKTRPEIIVDRFGIAYNAVGLPILNAQRDYFRKNHVYSENVADMIQSVDRNSFMIGYSNDFVAEIGGRCPSCVFRESSFKVMIIQRLQDKAEIWSIDENGTFEAVGSIDHWPQR